MTKFLLTVNYDGGVIETPMTEWAPKDVKAHMDYYQAQLTEIADSGELVDQQALTGPELAKIVTAGGGTAPVVTDGPFVEFKEMLAGYQLVDVDSERTLTPPRTPSRKPCWRPPCTGRPRALRTIRVAG